MSDRRWSWQHEIILSDLASTTRHVMLTLACHMNAVGENCFPSTKTIAKETGLSEKTVCTHLEIAEKAGWIEKKRHGYGGQKWSRNEYIPLWPNDKKGTEGGSAASPKALNLVPKGTEPNGKKALKEVQSNITNNITLNARTSARTGSPPANLEQAGGSPVLQEGEFIVQKFSDEWYRWKQYYKVKKDRSGLVFLNRMRSTSFILPSQYPPEISSGKELAGGGHD